MATSGASAGDIRLTLAEMIVWTWVDFPAFVWKPIAGNHEAWIDATMQNTWVDGNPGHPTYSAAFYRDRQRVFCRGIVSGGVDGDGIFDITGYVPAGDAYITVPQMDWVGSTPTTLCTIHVTNSGFIVTDGYSAGRSLSLDGVSWPLS